MESVQRHDDDLDPREHQVIMSMDHAATNLLRRVHPHVRALPRHPAPAASREEVAVGSGLLELREKGASVVEVEGSSADLSVLSVMDGASAFIDTETETTGTNVTTTATAENPVEDEDPDHPDDGQQSEGEEDSDPGNPSATKRDDETQNHREKSPYAATLKNADELVGGTEKVAREAHDLKEVEQETIAKAKELKENEELTGEAVQTLKRTVNDSHQSVGNDRKNFEARRIAPFQSTELTQER